MRWALFVAATDRKFKTSLNWDPYFEIADGPGAFEEKLPQYAALADAHFDTARFQEFCAEHLGPLDEVAWEFFGTADARDAVHEKVGALFPEHEVEKFTEHFWGSIQSWRHETAGAAPRDSVNGVSS